MAVTAALVKKLREATSAKMMDCKKALDECGGDFDAAVAWLRKKNLASGEKKQERAAEEGAIGYKVEDNAISVVQLSANTDFVARNDDFKKLLSQLVDLVHEKKINSAEDLLGSELNGTGIVDVLKEFSGTIGENIQIKEAYHLEGNFGYYVHHDGKQGAVVELEGVEGDEAAKIGKELAMHCVFAKPRYLTRDEVPAEEVAKEKKLIQDKLKDDPQNAKKPENILEKIAEGQIGKFYAQIVLNEQPFYRENKQKVTDFLKQEGGKASIKGFKFFKVGAA